LNAFTSCGISAQEEEFGDSISEMQSGKYPQYAVGVNFSMYLPNKASKGEKAIALSELDKLEQQYMSLKNILGVQIRNAHRNVLATRGSYLLKQDSEKLLADYLAIQNKNFSQGRISTAELLMAQNDCHSAKIKTITALVEYAKAVNIWKKFVGEYDTYCSAWINEGK